LKDFIHELEIKKCNSKFCLKVEFDRFFKYDLTYFENYIKPLFIDHLSIHGFDLNKVK